MKQHFQNNSQVYNDFLEIMKKFREEEEKKKSKNYKGWDTRENNTKVVIEKVKTLFDGHPELIEGFNTFLPPTNKISKEEAMQGAKGIVRTQQAQAPRSASP